MSTSNQHSEDDSLADYTGDSTVVEAPSNNSALTIASATKGEIERASSYRSTGEKKSAFLAALAEVGTVRGACTVAHVDRQTVYGWRDTDDAFRGGWLDAQDDVADSLEETMVKKGQAGEFLPAIAMLKAMRPAKFRDNYNDAARTKGGDVHVTFVIASPKPEPFLTIEAEAQELPEGPA